MHSLIYLPHSKSSLPISPKIFGSVLRFPLLLYLAMAGQFLKQVNEEQIVSLNLLLTNVSGYS